jgi:hypothetical protein
MFNFIKGPSMYPLCYSIMNLPPSMRNKVNIGLHVASFCDGCEASQFVLGEDLYDLWASPIVIEGRSYYVVVAQALMDGPGRTSYMKLRATTSLDGCPLCDVDARSWGTRQVYDSFRCYLPMKDPYRKRRHAKHHYKCADDPNNPGIMLQFAFEEKRPLPRNR